MVLLFFLMTVMPSAAAAVFIADVMRLMIGISKKQPNKIRMAPHYFYGLPSLTSDIVRPCFVVLVTWGDRMCILWHSKLLLYSV